MNRFKAHRRAVAHNVADHSAKLAHDLKAAVDEDCLRNHIGGGLLPSQLGWGQRKIDKARITLAPIWRKP